MPLRRLSPRAGPASSSRRGPFLRESSAHLNTGRLSAEWHTTCSSPHPSAPSTTLYSLPGRWSPWLPVRHPVQGSLNHHFSRQSFSHHRGFSGAPGLAARAPLLALVINCSPVLLTLDGSPGAGTSVSITSASFPACPWEFTISAGWLTGLWEPSSEEETTELGTRSAECVSNLVLARVPLPPVPS